MKTEEKQESVKALKAFDELPEEDRFVVFVQMENAKVCLGQIVENIATEKDNIMNVYFDDANTPIRDFIKTVIDWTSVYMKAGLEAGYTKKTED